MAITDERSLNALMYDLVGGRRFTQDSPIMRDVWTAFAAAPTEGHDLILSPMRDESAPRVAKDLRGLIYRWRRAEIGEETLETGEVMEVGWPPLEHLEGRKKRPRLASLQGRIAVTVYFDELMRIVLAMTPWWQPADERKLAGSPGGLRFGKGHALFGFPDPTDGDEEKMTEALTQGLERVRTLIMDGGGATSGERQPGEPRPSVLWVVRLAGAIALSAEWTEGEETFGDRLAEYLGLPTDAEPRDGEQARSRDFSEQIAKSFLNLYRFWPVAAPPAKRRLFKASLNRTAELAVAKSALTVKADAARLLFEISCRSITWAIIDSGIDQEHPAFRDHRAGGDAHRVKQVFDFTKLRDLLDPEVLGADGDGTLCGQAFVETPEAAEHRQVLMDDLKRRVPATVSDEDLEAQIVSLRKRICDGDDIDWGLLESFIVDHNPDRPRSEHGTHVAGVLGADWRDRDDPTKIVMQGVCPDIQLYDVRVHREDGRSDEFEALAAIQYLRYRNSRAGYMDVHGANMSLSIPHKVADYACGSTPICEECDDSVAQGMVIVAAAGNYGHVKYKTTDGLLGGYNTVSVTDPGNAAKVITVGSTHRKRPHEYGVSYFSSRGPTGDGRLKPDLVAPGEKIKAPTPNVGDDYKDGTSQAAPHVSGAAAMIMARHREFIGRPDRIKQLLCDTATDLGRERYFQGHGMLDILRALQSI